MVREGDWVGRGYATLRKGWFSVKFQRGEKKAKNERRKKKAKREKSGARKKTESEDSSLERRGVPAPRTFKGKRGQGVGKKKWDVKKF